MVGKTKKAAQQADPKKESGDYLGDDFVADDPSDDEPEAVPQPLIAEEEEDGEDDSAVGKKRKTLAALKEKRKKAKDGAPKREEACTVSRLATKKQAQFFLQHLRASQAGSRLSDIQVQDATKPANFVQFEQRGQSDSLAGLASNILQHAPACTSGDDEAAFPGAAPVAVVVVSSGERGARVWDGLASLNKQSPVIKAFGNHPKVKKLLQKFLESPKAASAKVIVGTAGRMLKLFQQGSLLPDRLALLVVDMNPDSKTRTLMDMKECKDDVMALLLTLLLPRLVDNSLRIAFS